MTVENFFLIMLISLLEFISLFHQNLDLSSFCFIDLFILKIKSIMCLNINQCLLSKTYVKLLSGPPIK